MTPKTPKGKARKMHTGDGRTNPLLTERKEFEKMKKDMKKH